MVQLAVNWHATHWAKYIMSSKCQVSRLHTYDAGLRIAVTCRRYLQSRQSAAATIRRDFEGEGEATNKRARNIQREQCVDGGEGAGH